MIKNFSKRGLGGVKRSKNDGNTPKRMAAAVNWDGLAAFLQISPSKIRSLRLSETPGTEREVKIKEMKHCVKCSVEILVEEDDNDNYCKECQDYYDSHA